MGPHLLNSPFVCSLCYKNWFWSKPSTPHSFFAWKIGKVWNRDPSKLLNHLLLVVEKVLCFFNKSGLFLVGYFFSFHSLIPLNSLIPNRLYLPFIHSYKMEYWKLRGGGFDFGARKKATFTSTPRQQNFRRPLFKIKCCKYDLKNGMYNVVEYSTCLF